MQTVVEMGDGSRNSEDPKIIWKCLPVHH
jgi:hypothetical protein